VDTGLGINERAGKPKNAWFPVSADGGGDWPFSLDESGARETRLLDEALTAESSADYGELHFIGRLWNVFVLVERDGRLYLIDQHAAHERVLYNRFLAKPVVGEPLLVPIPFTAEKTESDFLHEHAGDLVRFGFELVEEEHGNWRIERLPPGWTASDRETIENILALPRTGAGFFEAWAATCACHTAIRDGAYLDEQSALSLAWAALSMPVQRCPHGRPIWVEIRKEDVLSGVKRL
jgi:DNA mismatch repair protein MutL